MQRLRERYPDSKSCMVLSNQETEVLLLLDNRHVKFEKDNLGYLTNLLDKTTKKELIPKDVVSHVFKVYPYLYSEDIEKIEESETHFTINVYPNTLIHFGQFKIYKE